MPFSSMEVKKVKAIQFGLINPEELVRIKINITKKKKKKIDKTICSKNRQSSNNRSGWKTNNWRNK